MSAEILIRVATAEDAAEIARVQVETWQSHYRGQLEDAYLDSLSIRHRTGAWNDLLSNPQPQTCTFIAASNGEIGGFASSGFCRDEDRADHGELWAVYVHPSVQGLGAGSALMAASLQFLREQNYHDASLWVLRSNLTSIDWYCSRGWKADGCRKRDETPMRVFEEIRMTTEL